MRLPTGVGIRINSRRCARSMKQDEGDHSDPPSPGPQNEAGDRAPLAAEIERAGDRGTQLRHDARQDDERDPLPDAARGVSARGTSEHGDAGEREQVPMRKNQPGS